MLGFERHKLARADLEATPGCRDGCAFAIGVVQATFVVTRLVQAGVDEVNRPPIELGPVAAQAGVVAFHHAGHIGPAAGVVIHGALAVAHRQIGAGQAGTVEAVQ